MQRWFTLLIFFFSLQAICQKFADKSYYLVDSLVYENISPEYQFLIDNNLEVYHKAKTDMERVTAVNQIVKLCWDENVWPKYNQWVYNYTREKLKEPQSETTKFELQRALAGSIYYIGWNYSVQTDYDKCIFYYEQCAAIYLEIGDSIGLANSLDNIGGIYLIKGESAKALDYFMKGLSIREKINDKLGTGSSLNNIGSVYMEHGDYTAALKEFKRALSLHDSVNFISGVSTALNNLGSIEFYFGNYESALSFFQRSLAINDHLGDKQGKALSLTQIGLVNMMLEDYNAAQDYFKESVDLYTEIGDKHGTAAGLSNLGLICGMQENYKKAVGYFNQSLSLAEETGDAIERRAALEGLFQVHVLQGDYNAAEKNILELIAMRRHDVNVNFIILPEQKKELYLSTMTRDFMNLYAFASLRKVENPAITETAFNNVLKLKGLLLQSTTVMRQAILASGDAVLIDKYTSWINLKEKIADAYAVGGETASLEAGANELEKELIKSSAAFSAFNQNADLNWKDIQATLKPGEAAIEYVHFNPGAGKSDSSIRYAALIVTPGITFPKMVELCTAWELEALLGTSHANNLNYIQQLYGTRKAPNHALYNLVWAPIENDLAGIHTVYLSATGLLHKIAFSALSNEQDEFLCDNYRLVDVSSTARLVGLKSFEFAPGSTASLFGGVKYSTEKTRHVIWNYLQGSLTEIDSIQKTLGKQVQVNYYSQELATEAHFKEAAVRSNFVHIASHGFFYPDPELVQKQTYKEEMAEDLDFRGGGASYGIWNFVNNKNPLMRSGIALAGANDMWHRGVFEEGEDGVLTAQEVTTLNMSNTDLVVLSACETGLGDIRGSEGVYGLQRAFKMAGVRYLIMSLWQVPDAETAEFMILFYNKLLAEKDIRRAFSETQAAMRAKYDPYFWAAFVLIE